MKIWYITSRWKYRKILKECNKYWNLLRKTPLKKSSVYSRDAYTIAVNRNCIDIWCSKDVRPIHINEIKHILTIAFNHPKTKGYIEYIRPEEKPILSVTDEIPNIKKNTYRKTPIQKFYIRNHGCDTNTQQNNCISGRTTRKRINSGFT